MNSDTAPPQVSTSPQRVVIVGVGLLGGSLLAALQTRRTSAGGTWHLTAVSSEVTLAGLVQRAWCDALHPYDQLGDACDGADIVLLCTPLTTIRQQITTIAALRDRLAPRAIVMDVGSTKAQICAQGFLAFPPSSGDAPRFVGGHPMAGSEKSGLEAADPLLYQSALWVLCPPSGLSDDRLDGIRALIRDIGGRPALIDPDLHDAAVARISHVPQVLASTLADWAGDNAALTDAALTLAAGGFRDMSRLALSSWEVWRDIVASNRAPIAEGLRELSARLAVLADAARFWEADGTVDSQSSSSQTTSGEAAFRLTFTGGKALRQRFYMPRKGILHDLSEFVVRLDDRPGQLLALFAPLAAKGINVQDLEILKVREGESGTILIGFATPHDASQARGVLESQGFALFDR
jgi:prephenate dehydrogenase